MHSRQPRSRQEAIQQKQRSQFFGREQQLQQFRYNLSLPAQDWCFLFNIWGQGGVGKSTLTRQFRKLAEQQGCLKQSCLTAGIDEGCPGVPEAMAQLAEQLQQGQGLDKFQERYRVYRQKQQELESDPEAPQGLSALVGRTVAKASLGLAKQLPGSGAVTPFLDQEAIVTQAGEWAAFVAKRLTHKEDVRLVLHPIEVLTPLFLQGLAEVAVHHSLLLAFDTYERTASFLDDWLRAVLQGKHGDLPLNLLLVIAGRDPLDANVWADYAEMMASIPLDPFTEAETKHYLSGKGITEPRVVEVIWRLSEGLPVLVATLAANSPQTPEQVGEPSGTAIERFLQWETDPKRRQAALDAALVGCLNRDLLAQLTPADEAEALFDWLKKMPFVQETSEGWLYHDIVRMQMLRYKRRESPQSWAALHDKLAAYFDQQRQSLGLETDQQQTDATWQGHTLSWLYHRLCQAPQKHLPLALNEFLLAWKTDRKFAKQWGDILAKAGKDAEVNDLRTWGEQINQGLAAYDQDRYEVTLALFAALLRDVALGEKEQAIAFARRGETYRLMKRYETALQDFNRAIELNPDYSWAIAWRGVTYGLMKQYEEALQDFNRAIELDPDDSWAIALRGQTYGLMNRYEEALQDLNRAIELEPDYSWAIARRGQTHWQMKQYKAALPDLNRAIELDPEEDWKLYIRALIYQALDQADRAQGDLAQAIQLAQQTYEKQPQNDQNTFNLAIYYLAASDRKRAIHFYKDAIQRGATASSIREAIQDLAELLAVLPQHQLARQAKAFLQQQLRQRVETRG